ncbi:ATP-binding protein [Streptomyces sp. NPDC052114]|uniref:ATP-binding protein n=1 Tax=unclassified Streptomyces TaxID=2593676 RepID=UPI003446C1A4
MTPQHNDTLRPRQRLDPPADGGTSLFLGEPLATTKNLAVGTGFGSTPFAARSIPATTDCCYIARQFTRGVLRRWNLQEVCDDTVQIASELVANAVRHGRRRTAAEAGRTGVWLALAPRPHTLLCVVRDSSRRRPQYAPPPPLSERNRGLPIVEALAASWGWTTDADAQGKTVWARVALSDA